MPSPLSTLLTAGPSGLKRYLSFGGTGGYQDPAFWLNEARSRLFSSGAGSTGHHETIGESLDDYIAHAYKANGVVFTCVLVRMLAFSEASFLFQQMNNGIPGEMFWDPKLRLLEQPWPNGTTGDLLTKMEQDASLAGNFFATPNRQGHLRRLRPDWTTIVSGIRDDPDGSPFDLEAEVLGYIYHPDPSPGRRRPDPVLLSTDRVVHYAPIPDPDFQWRGMSWMTPVLREIDGDTAAMRHKLKFFQHGATSNLAIKYPADMPKELFEQYVALFTETHTGVDQAYKAMHFGSGADPVMLGADMKQLDFKVVQGHGETRIAAASGAGAIIARLSEGMQGSSLNQGNYDAAKKQFGDMTIRPLWRMAAGALSRVASPPDQARLWYHDRDVAFLAENAKDEAEIFEIDARAIRSLTDGGFKPDSVIDAVAARNARLLVPDPDYVPVQQQLRTDATTATDGSD